MKKGVVFFTIIVLAVTLAVPTWGAQQQQTPATQQQTPQPKPATIMMPTIRGHVNNPSGQGVGGVEITLSKFGTGGYKTYITDGAGAYHFAMASEDIGGGYKIAPKHKDFPAGQYFTPNEKQIILAAGDNTIDFSFNPPKPDLIVVAIDKQVLSQGVPREDDMTYKLKISVRNNGTVNAGQFKVFVEKTGMGCGIVCIPGSPVAMLPYPVNGLMAGTTIDLVHPEELFDGWSAAGTTHEWFLFKVTVDGGYEVDESNESNNIMTKQFQLRFSSGHMQ